MFSQTKAWQSYRQVATQTASPGQLVLLLYNGIIRFLEQARTGFSIDDPKEFNETINNNIQRAQGIIHEMSLSLNMAQGGDFAQRMRSLYDYFDRRLQESNMAKTEPAIVEVIKHVTVLRDAWAEMLQRGNAQQVRGEKEEVRSADTSSFSPLTSHLGGGERVKGSGGDQGGERGEVRGEKGAAPGSHVAPRTSHFAPPSPPAPFRPAA